jgi:hypothetical protein
MSNTAETTEEFRTIRELARRWKLGRHAVFQLIVNEPGVIRVFTGLKEKPRYRVPESVAVKIEQGLFQVNQGASNE